jgi:hypothetical protein
MSKYIYFINLKHFIFKNGGGSWQGIIFENLGPRHSVIGAGF